MKKSRLLGVLSAYVLVLITYTSNSEAAYVDFSFENDGGSVAGTVTGRIFGLSLDGAGQSATSVIINSFPAGLGGSSLGLDAITWGVQSANSFDLVGGVVTGASLKLISSTTPLHLLCLGDSGGCFTSQSLLPNFLTFDQGGTRTGNNGGFAGVSFSSAAVPVPAAVWLFGSGLFGLIGVARRKKA